LLVPIRGRQKVSPPEKDFTPVSLVAETSGLLVAYPSFPPNNVKAFMEGQAAVLRSRLAAPP